MNNSVVYRDVFHNPVLQPTFKNCIIYTAAYLLVLARSGTAGVKHKVD